MVDEEFSDVDLGTLGRMEQHGRYQALDRLQRAEQLTLPALDQLSDAELSYLSGHRDWIESKHDHQDAGNSEGADRATLGTQQKVRGNAWRAKDVLDRRIASRQLDALEASNDAVARSNRHMKATAWGTWVLAVTTIALVIVTLVGNPGLNVRPEVNVTVEVPTSTTTTVLPDPTEHGGPAKCGRDGSLCSSDVVVYLAMLCEPGVPRGGRSLLRPGFAEPPAGGGLPITPATAGRAESGLCPQSLGYGGIEVAVGNGHRQGVADLAQ